MKTLLLTATALAVVCTLGLSPAMANRFGPFDTRLTDDSDALGQNGRNAATTTLMAGIMSGNTATDMSGRGIGSPSSKGD